ncbi:FxsA family protein [Naumannella halotolerans]|uniref:UPF0716 protein FxsA n=1 Tax=Naumannella halotolerans TaxID=993414 RepID=A0A4R7J7Y9_9ACTN|nr:FxsA family protein [Naumannella halotolerans]TDT33385.1 UPF0716 protein FxsA [Naumannella halotolerans]
MSSDGTMPRRPAGQGLGFKGRLVLALFLLLPLLEILVLVQVVRWIGWWTLLVLIVGALLGSWLTRREGGKTWERLAEASAAGRTPTTELLDSGLVMLGGIALIVPGLITDVIALILLLPFTRPLPRRLLSRCLRRRFGGLTDQFQTQRGRMGGTVIDGEVVEGDVVSGDVVDPEHRRLEP